MPVIWSAEEDGTFDDRMQMKTQLDRMQERLWMGGWCTVCSGVFFWGEAATICGKGGPVHQLWQGPVMGTNISNEDPKGQVRFDNGLRDVFLLCAVRKAVLAGVGSTIEHERLRARGAFSGDSKPQTLTRLPQRSLRF